MQKHKNTKTKQKNGCNIGIPIAEDFFNEINIHRKLCSMKDYKPSYIPQFIDVWKKKESYFVCYTLKFQKVL